MNSLIGLLLLASTLPPPIQERTGDWAGWLYMDDGDVPVRMRMSQVEERFEVHLDLPAAGQMDILLGSVALEEERLTLLHPSSEDPGIRMELTFEDEWLAAGKAHWFGVDGQVHLHRSEEPIDHEDPELSRDVVGHYGSLEDPGVFVYSQPWGELVLVDTVLGSERTLFARETAGYVVGPGFYVPAPIEQEIDIERDEHGDVAALRLRSRDGERLLPRREVHREPVRLEREGAVLHGTLILPDLAGAACAVFAGGSNWTDRSDVDSFALVLAAHGAASVVYDKRGHGLSGGSALASFETTALDLVAFAELARSSGEVDPHRVGYFGISRGGWYGSLAAAQDPGCAFFVDMVGPAVSPAAQETTARLDRMGEAGASEEDLDLGRRYLDALWHFGRTEEDGDAYLELRQQVDATGWLGQLHGPADLEPEDWEWTRRNADFDPALALGALRCPTLCLFGEEDLAVASRINAPLMRSLLSAEKAEVLVFPGCNHSLQTVQRDGGGQRLPFHRMAGRHPEVWPTIIEFLNGLQ